MRTWPRTLPHLLILCILVIEVAPSQLRGSGRGQALHLGRMGTQPATLHQLLVKSDPTPSFYKRKAEWKRIIDAYWGPGDPLSTKRNVFDTYAAHIRANFPAFVYSKLNWDSVTAHWRAQITDSTSRGAFHALLYKFSYTLNEWHAYAGDNLVWSTPMIPGAPVANYEVADMRHFGAALTPLPDKSLLVYKVAANQPLGLQPGDRVLGYEGVPWPQLFDELTEAGVGTDFLVGACPSVKEYYRLAFAGTFWHLFDTIDVVKYGTGQIVHLPTAPLATLDTSVPLLHCDQLPVAGVSMPSENLLAGDITYGTVQGTNVGYIYVRHHMDPKISVQFDAAVRALANTEGLVIDLRLDWGGEHGLEWGIARLMSFGDSTLQFRRRYSASDMQTMVPASVLDVAIPVDRGTVYDHPIAVLVGPQCRSWGDLSTYQLSFIPGVRFFGKSPTGAYSGYWWNNAVPAKPGYTLYCPNFIEVDHRFPNVQLLNNEFPVDEEVWLTPDGVARGEDDVVKRALEWIQTQPYVYHVAAKVPYSPAGVDSFTVTGVLRNPNSHSMSASLILATAGGTFVDSTVLLNDGQHGDGLPGDSILGCRFPSPPTEGFFRIDLRTRDLTTGQTRLLPGVSLITTLGPVVCVGDTSSATPRWGQTIGFRLKISTAGSMWSIPNIDGVIRPLDTGATLASSDPSFMVGDVAPGEIRLGSPIRIVFSPSDSGTKDVNFELLLSSGGTFYWKDTLTIRVFNPSDHVADEQQTPSTFALEQNYPNPFNPSTTIRFTIAGVVALSGSEGAATKIRLVVYDLLGREVAVMLDGQKAPGRYQVEFDGAKLASGVYICRMIAGAYVASRKMILTK
jgi:hypothetical protein